MAEEDKKAEESENTPEEEKAADTQDSASASDAEEKKEGEDAPSAEESAEGGAEGGAEKKADKGKKKKVEATIDGVEPVVKPDEHQQARVLIVEDSPPLRRMLEKILTSDGFIVDTAEDGQKAIEALEARPFEYSFMMLDIMMPVLDGIKTMATIRKNDMRGIPPVVICSCRSDKETVMLANKLGVAGYILKPFKTETVIHKVREVVAKEGQEEVEPEETK